MNNIVGMQIVFAGGTVGGCIETAHKFATDYNTTVSFKVNGIIWTVTAKDSVSDLFRQYDDALKTGKKTIGYNPQFLKHE